MKPSFKPFRLITHRELETLRQDFAKKLQDWNEQHALFPLSYSLNAQTNWEVQEQDLLLFLDQCQPIAFLPYNQLSAMKECLFRDLSPCFDEISRKQLTQLLNLLLNTQLIDDTSAPLIKSDWFYKGSPSVALTMSTTIHVMTVTLHPNWVLKNLSKQVSQLKPKANLQEAIAPQKLHYQVELSPLSLQLNDLITLRIGDVIQTEHKLSDPIHLKHQNKRVAEAHLGESKPFKSIKIVSSK